MPVYNAPIRDMQFVMHEVLNVTEELKPIAKYADAARLRTTLSIKEPH